MKVQFENSNLRNLKYPVSVDCNQLSTTKLVATKLIAEGKLWEGVQLLCLVGKVWDACTYLRYAVHVGEAAVSLFIIKVEHPS